VGCARGKERVLTLPEIAPRWAALLLSFVLGAFVIAAAKLRYLPAAGYWLINSLNIFAVAPGSAGVAAKSTGAVSTRTAALARVFVPSAVAKTLLLFSRFLQTLKND
jgi:hypothetical protein